MAYDPNSLAGVPEHGRERIAQMKRGLFTSDLSVDEFLLVKAAGFEPLGLRRRQLDLPHRLPAVVRGRTAEEMEVLSQAMYSARELAMTRMEEEADQLGADGVVGVRLDIGRYEWGAEHGRVHRDRHRDQARRGRASSRAERSAVHERPLGPGLLDAARLRPPAGRNGHGLVRLPRRPSVRCGRR